MKKMMTRFAENLLSKEQMKNVKGGLKETTFSCTCNDGGCTFSGAVWDVNDIVEFENYYCGSGGAKCN